jgi:hypothetical protein
MADDLFTAADQVDAERAVAKAKAARAEAVNKARYAPPGRVLERRGRAVAATLETLRAEVELRRVCEARNKH